GSASVPSTATGCARWSAPPSRRRHLPRRRRRRRRRPRRRPPRPRPRLPGRNRPTRCIPCAPAPTPSPSWAPIPSSGPRNASSGPPWPERRASRCWPYC
ncbi:hypothetical protein EF904_26715, partial [Streptomyces sp. WAC05950]